VKLSLGHGGRKSRVKAPEGRCRRISAIGAWGGGGFWGKNKKEEGQLKRKSKKNKQINDLMIEEGERHQKKELRELWRR
jgi:hypothetical protein